jgi:hypothetical protein
MRWIYTDFLVPARYAHRYTQVFAGRLSSEVAYLAPGDMQTFQVFTGAAPGGSSTSAIHGSRKTWKV